MTKIINLFAGPGAGKSTTASGIFYLMKSMGINCELILEYAKDLTWEKRTQAISNQVYVFGKQVQRLERVMNQVDYIITDSPILLSLIYNNNEPLSFSQYVVDKFKSYHNINFFIKRDKDYNPAGRNQTLEEAIEIDNVILDILDANYIPYKIINSDTDLFSLLGII